MKTVTEQQTQNQGNVKDLDPCERKAKLGHRVTAGNVGGWKRQGNKEHTGLGRAWRSHQP